MKTKLKESEDLVIVKEGELAGGNGKSSWLIRLLSDVRFWMRRTHHYHNERRDFLSGLEQSRHSRFWP